MPRHYFPFLILLALAATAGCTSAPSADESVASADAYFTAKKYPEAIVEYRKALSIDPKLGKARFNLAVAYEETKDRPRAYAEYVRAADLLPDDVEAQMRAARFLLAAGRYEDAKSRAQNVLARDPKHVDAQILRGNAAAGMKDFSSAVSDIEEAIKMAPGDDRGYSQLGMMKLAQGAGAEAETAFREAVKVKPESVGAQLALAGFYWTSGRFQEAEPVMKEALRLEPNNPQVQRALATFYMSMGRAAEAEAPLKRVVELSKDKAGQLALADYYIMRRRTPEALPLLNAAAAQPNGAADAARRLAAIDFAENRRPEAYARIEAGLQKDPKHLDLLQQKARFLLIDRKLDEALSTAKQAATENPNSAATQFLLGAIHEASQDPASAALAYKEVLRLNPRAVSAQARLAELSIRTGAAPAALQFAEQALRNAKDDPRARLLLVRSLAAGGQLARARTELTELLREFPKSPTLHADAGRIALLGNNRSLARKEFELARQLDPNSLEAISGQIGLELVENKGPDARRLIDGYLQKFPKSPEVLMLSSMVYGAQGKVKEQEADLRKILEVDANHLKAYNELAGLFIRTNRLAEARKEYEGLAARQPKSVTALTMVALLYEAENKPAEARKLYEQVLAAAPDSAVASNNLAWMMAEQGGNLDVALQMAQAAARSLPDAAEVSDTIGWIQLKQERYPLAVSAFESSSRLDPRAPIYQYHLGLAHQKLGNFAKSKQAFEAALKLAPDYKDARDALARLTGK